MDISDISKILTFIDGKYYKIERVKNQNFKKALVVVDLFKNIHFLMK